MAGDNSPTSSSMDETCDVFLLHPGVIKPIVEFSVVADDAGKKRTRKSGRSPDVVVGGLYRDVVSRHCGLTGVE